VTAELHRQDGDSGQKKETFDQLVLRTLHVPPIYSACLRVSVSSCANALQPIAPRLIRSRAQRRQLAIVRIALQASLPFPVRRAVIIFIFKHKRATAAATPPKPLLETAKMLTAITPNGI
jgi:hypothetical protein